MVCDLCHLPAAGDVAHDRNASCRLCVDANDIPKAHAAAEVLDAWILVVVGAEPAEPRTSERRGFFDSCPGNSRRLSRRAITAPSRTSSVASSKLRAHLPVGEVRRVR